ncbi:MAG: (2Fe-2S)-binding protein [Asticcacaulis sp. 32-58-5]|nr:MAG: (2Fe-2S)-binding protein [Asticcacaulis sp. 32-58-5]
MALKLPSRDLIASFDSSDIDLADAQTLPPECYTDADFYEFEKEALYYHEWLCVGRESWVKNPGDYFTTNIAGEPIVVARGRDGKVNAMSSVCAHRAMLVAEGSGNTRMFLCPYHHWAYGLDGKLTGAPAMEKTCNFNKEEHGLTRFAVEIWHGFIFVNFDLDAAPLAPRLTDVSDAIAGYDLANADGDKPEKPGVFPWNWKVMFENNNDGYHASKLHQGPLHDFVPSDLAMLKAFLACEAAEALQSFQVIWDRNCTQLTSLERAVLEHLESHYGKLGEDDWGRIIARTNAFQEAPLFIDDSQDTGVLVAPGASKHPSFGHKMEMNMVAAMHIIDQDMHVDELVQVGLRSKFAPRGRYSWQEGAQIQFNRWLIKRYRDAYDRLTGSHLKAVKGAA